MMKSLMILIIVSFSLMIPCRLFTQCTDTANPPVELFSPSPENCGVPFPSTAPIQPATPYFLPGMLEGFTYVISFCDLAFPPAQMELAVIDDLTTPQVLAHTIGCSIEFRPPSDGDFYVVFNVVAQCGISGPPLGIGISVEINCPCNHDRVNISALILDPLNGLEFFPALSSMWMPPVDFGFGPGFEGMVPVGTVIDPAELGFGPWPGPGLIAPWDAYVFWIDDLPGARFQHPTRFVLVDPRDCAPSFDNGSILIAEEGWWPIIDPPLLPPLELFGGDNLTDQPPGPANPEGLIAGHAGAPGDVVIEPNPPANNSPKMSAGLVVAGDDRADMRGDIPRWKRQLQDSYGVDSTRILCAENDSAVTKQQFCDLMDSLCTKFPMADTFYIRISSHGSIGSLSFKDGRMSSRTFCDKIRKLSKKGKPIMLLIDACHTASLLDANNWGMPAGSMVIVGAASGSCALGTSSAFEADDMGNPIPNTGFTGGMLSTALINCKNDTTDTNGDGKTDADTNKDGNVDDCEAFNWVNTQKPCFVRILSSSYSLGSFIINKRRYYPAGPPAGFVPDSTFVRNGRTYYIKDGAYVYANPMPSYVAVGKFSNTMNFNVQNNSGGAKNVFYMVFEGDVSDAYGIAWNSDVNDNRSTIWSNPANVTSSYDAGNDETIVCWMTSGGDAANGSYIHFGYISPDGQRLRPKRQYWANNVGFKFFAGIPDTDKVPGAISSILLHGTGELLTVRIANPGVSAGGWGENINYNAGYRVSQVDIPLENLFLQDPMVSSLAFNFAGAGNLDTSSVFTFDIDIPDEMKVGEVLILELNLTWNLNNNSNTMLLQWPKLEAAICEGDMVYNIGDPIPNQTNSSGTITLNDIDLNGGLTTFNAQNGIIMNQASEISEPAIVDMYTHGCEEGPPILPRINASKSPQKNY